ncbi:MAG TPA: glycoside hydrolase family 3 N-terminal domain-containing protein [Magnetospirillum sp.]|nr:glycoside hydrolase family 3 N-terminal domain-containing protein [Magnetospirillum sp.]
MGRMLLWSVGALLLIVGANINDPFLMRFRFWCLAAMAVIWVAGMWTVARKQGGAARHLLLLVWLGIPCAVAAAQGALAWRQLVVMSADAEVARLVGRHFMIGYDSFDDAAPLVRRGLVGGLYVTRRNLEGRSAAELGAEIARLQDIRKAEGLPPLLVATDQEGGTVSHLSPALTALPPLASVADMPAPLRHAAARDYGAQHGRELAALGINVNFAPVVDLQVPHPPSLLDWNSRIGKRAISGDPAVVGQVALGYARGLAEAGVRPTVKHFPGMGRVTADTHVFRATLATPKDELARSDWQPFRDLLSASDAMVMVGHVVVSDIDPDRPASHSRRVIDGVLRGEWGFDGPIITDDLVMGAVYHHGLCTAVEEALNAGVDLLLVAYDGRQYYRAMGCALTALGQGRLDSATLTRSETRLARVHRPAPLDMASAAP